MSEFEDGGLHEITIEMMRGGEECLTGFADDEWSQVVTAIEQAGGLIRSESALREAMVRRVGAVLAGEEDLQRRAASRAALQDAREIAIALKKKLLEITEPLDQAAAVGNPHLREPTYGMEQTIIDESYRAFRRTLDRLIRTVSKRQRQHPGRPADWLTKEWCRFVSEFVEQECGIPLKDARGKTNSGMIDVLDTLWAIVRPRAGGRDHRRAIQIALSKLPKRRIVKSQSE